jgi:putative transposase
VRRRSAKSCADCTTTSRPRRPYRGLSELTYPFHDRTITVTQCGRVCMAPHKITISTVFAGQKVGVKQVADQV